MALLTQSYVHGASPTPLIGETIGQVLRRVTAEGPERLAQVTRHQGVRWSYADLLRRSEDLAIGLRKLGLEKGDRVGIWSPNVSEWVVAQISSHNIEQYKAQQVKHGFTNKTTRNRLTVLNKCLATAYEWLRLDGAAPKIKWPKCVAPDIDYLSPEECELLLSHADGVMYEMILTALRTGMRQGEIKGLQWSSVDWLNRSVAVRHSQDDYRKVLVPPKSNRTRHMPLDTDVYEMLYRRKGGTGYVFLAPDGQPFNNDRLNYAIGKLREKAGLRKIGWHTLRHTFASHLAMRGVPLPAIKELMGHSDHHDDNEVRARGPVDARIGNRNAEPANDGRCKFWATWRQSAGRRLRREKSVKRQLDRKYGSLSG